MIRRAIVVALCLSLSACGGIVRDMWTLTECAINQHDINKRCS